MARRRRAGPFCLALLLAGALALLALRGGLFDPPLPEGMVADPCPSESADPEAAGAGFFAWLRGGRAQIQDLPGFCVFRRDNERLIRAGVRPRLVMIGDSITWRWRQHDPAWFGDAIVNRGVEGHTSAQMLLRFRQDVVALRPRAVHIMAGLNDIRGPIGPTRPEDYRDNIRAMVEIAQANGIAVVLGGVTPAWQTGSPAEGEPRARWMRYRAALDRWLRAYAAERGIAFADYQAVLLDARGRYRRSFYDDDGVHLAAPGYAAMRPVAEAAVERAEGAGRSPLERSARAP